MTDFLTTSRRGFLAAGLRLLLAGGVASPALDALATPSRMSDSVDAKDPTREQNEGEPTAEVLDPAKWKLIEAIQAHLLPSEPGKPGARELNAGGYLRRVLADPRLEAEDRRFIDHGLLEFETLCQTRYAKDFLALTMEQREAALRSFETSATGHHWLAEMLEFLMEALLGDPSHGGNPKGIGWKWLGIQPGFPLPKLSRGG